MRALADRRAGAQGPAARSTNEHTSNDTLARLAAVIESRRGGDPDKSYVARLFAKGTDAILKKIGEEATEVGDGGQGRRRASRLVDEVADLWFHSMIALAAFGLRPADVLAELERREGLSGLEEFASRKAQRRDEGGQHERRDRPCRDAGRRKTPRATGQR